jgi:sucrose phosphorylase
MKTMDTSSQHAIQAGPMLNAYPDSIGGTLQDAVQFLARPELRDVFQAFYILPSIFNTDLDRGFSIIDYELNEAYASPADLEQLQRLGIALKFDLVLNHASVLSRPFQDIIRKGEQSRFADFFINWNKFWAGHGQMTPEGYIQPDPELIREMFFRKPGLPILMVRLPDGKEVPYWNTFYQEVKYGAVDAQDLIRSMEIQFLTAERLAGRVNAALEAGKRPAEIDFGPYGRFRNGVIDLLESRRKYLGQLDLNIQSPLVWEYYEDTLRRLAGYGAQIVRLDAFAYAPKEPGAKNFLNEPGTWALLRRIRLLADRYGLVLLPEIHARYEEKIHEKLAEEGYMTYDFFLPGLIIDAFERQQNDLLLRWIDDIQSRGLRPVNMLGCHDGIPLLDLKGLVPDDQIDKLIATVVDRGGYVKDLHGATNIYYQVNATYFSALGEDEQRMLLARAIQIFMPGKPQVWYLDLFAGRNDHAAVAQAGPAGHKEINRTNLSPAMIAAGLRQDIVLRQLALLRFRNTCPAFGFDARLSILSGDAAALGLHWENKGYCATLQADLRTGAFTITAGPAGSETPLDL